MNFVMKLFKGKKQNPRYDKTCKTHEKAHLGDWILAWEGHLGEQRSYMGYLCRDCQDKAQNSPQRSKRQKQSFSQRAAHTNRWNLRRKFRRGKVFKNDI